MQRFPSSSGKRGGGGRGQRRRRRRRGARRRIGSATGPGPPGRARSGRRRADEAPPPPSLTPLTSLIRLPLVVRPTPHGIVVESTTIPCPTSPAGGRRREERVAGLRGAERLRRETVEEKNGSSVP